MHACLELVLLWSCDQSLTLIASFFLLLYQCKPGHFASSVHQGADIHWRLSTQYGDSAVLRRSEHEWIEKFKSGRTYVTHEEGAGRPSTSTTDEKIQ